VRESHRTSLALLSALLLLTAALAAAGAEPGAGSPWALFEILADSAMFQDISGDTVVYRQFASDMMLIDIKSGETMVLDDFRPCGTLPNSARIEGNWLVVQFQCLDAGETEFQSHVYNLETGETFLLEPDPPDPALPYSWYVDIHDGRVVWSQLAGCDSGDIYMLDLETRDINKIADGSGERAMMNLHLGSEWLVWDEIEMANDRTVSLRGTNLITSQTITVTQGNRKLGYLPLVGNGTVVWNEAIFDDTIIWVYDLESQDIHQLDTIGPYPFVADRSGDLLLLLESVGGLSDAPAGAQGGSPNEPCEHSRPYDSGKNQVRVHDLAAKSDAYVYHEPEADSLYRARIDGTTSIWVERIQISVRHVLAARRLDRQVYAPLVFR
jgi:hypothetical protein